MLILRRIPSRARKQAVCGLFFRHLLYRRSAAPREGLTGAGRRELSMFQTAIPVIRVSSSAAAEAFYCKGLGFTILASWRPDQTKDDPCYMTLACDDARLHVHSYQSGASGTSAVYIFVDDVDSLYAELISKGVPVSGPPVDQSWGTREIGVRDPDRNILTFGQRLSPSR